MRNGHTARIDEMLHLPYGDNKKFHVWKGICLDCAEHKTWNVNGTYAAFGRHALDILGPLKKTTGADHQTGIG